METHDHQQCIRQAMDSAIQVCRSRGARLTPLRQQVLTLVWHTHKPIGAYEVLDLLRRDHPTAAPPTVYRALDFLLAHGLIHRVESRNAYVGCRAPGNPHSCHLLLCQHCGQARELLGNAIDRAIEASARDEGFQITARTVEISGACRQCRSGEAGHA